MVRKGKRVMKEREDGRKNTFILFYLKRCVRCQTASLWRPPPTARRLPSVLRPERRTFSWASSVDQLFLLLGVQLYQSGEGSFFFFIPPGVPQEEEGRGGGEWEGVGAICIYLSFPNHLRNTAAAGSLFIISQRRT